MEEGQQTEEEIATCPKCGRRHRDDPPRLVDLAEMLRQALVTETDDVFFCVATAANGALRGVFEDEVTYRERLHIQDNDAFLVQIRELMEWSKNEAMQLLVREVVEKTIEERRKWAAQQGLDVDCENVEAFTQAVVEAFQKRMKQVIATDD